MSRSRLGLRLEKGAEIHRPGWIGRAADSIYAASPLRAPAGPKLVLANEVRGS